MNLSNIKTAVTQFVGRTGLQLQKHSPEILIGVGIVATVGAVVSTIIATKKSEEIVEDHKFDVYDIKDTYRQNPDPENEVPIASLSKEEEKDYKHDLTRVYLHTGLELAKLYTPTILLTATSIASFLGAYGIVHKRNVALTAAYTAVSEAFKSYRKAVVEELGEDKDDQFRRGLALNNEVSEDGTVETKLTPVGERSISQYAKFFDEYSRNWKKSPEHNLAFLKCQQDYCNQMLRINGHLFLNEVYDRLDVPRTKAGAIVGWVMGEGNENYVDFGIFDGQREAARNFVNGYEPSILLDFNVDGIIYDLI